MMLAVFLAAMIVTEADQKAALEEAQRQTDNNAPYYCAVGKALDYTEATTETADAIARFAVQACSAYVSQMHLSYDGKLRAAKEFEQKIAAQVMEWRVRARKEGGFDKIRAEFGIVIK